MARTYARDKWGRFASRGGAPASRSTQLRLFTGAKPKRASSQPTFTGQTLKAGAGRGTAKPKGTISGTRSGRSRDAFLRDMGGGRGAVARTVKRGAPNRLKARVGEGWARSSSPINAISGTKRGRAMNQEVRSVFGRELKAEKTKGKVVGRGALGSAKRSRRKP